MEKAEVTQKPCPQPEEFIQGGMCISLDAKVALSAPFLRLCPSRPKSTSKK
jgi:hypothetical protein